MKNSINTLKNSMTKTKMITTFALILMASMLLSMAMVPIQAQTSSIGVEGAYGGNAVGPNWAWQSVPSGVTPSYTETQLPFLSVIPNPIGVGQMWLINAWITEQAGPDRFMAGYTITLTAPSGATQVITLNSYVADGTTWIDYTPNQVGTWQIDFTWPGEYFPAGYYSSGVYEGATTTGTYYNSTWFNPMTTGNQNYTVQQALVAGWSGLDTMTKLPTTVAGEYWSYPIEPNNREWSVIAGNYPWELQSDGAQSATQRNYYGPYVTTALTPHIIWDEQGALAGIVGGEAGQLPVEASAPTPSLIYMGRCYATVTKSINGGAPTSYAECYNLQTGQIYYDIATANGGVTPNEIAYWPPSDVLAGLASTVTVELCINTGTFLYKVNPWTGAVTYNLTLPSAGPSSLQSPQYTNTPNNNCLFYNGYYLSFQNAGTSANPSFYFVNWTEDGSGTFASRIVSNITLNRSEFPGGMVPPQWRIPPTPSAAESFLGSYSPVSGIGVQEGRYFYAQTYGSNLLAINYVTGQMQWNITSTPDEQIGYSPFNPATALNENGMYMCYFEQGVWRAYNIYTGAVVWTTNLLPTYYPWGEFTLYTAAGYDGILYMIGYTGVFAFNETNGNILWHYVDPAPPFETPYQSNGTECYSVGSIKIIDGMAFSTNSEHTPTMPAERGWGMICLNATTGAFLWKIMGTDMDVGPAADGYLVGSSSYDGMMYVLGMGLSATTVSAPQTAITAGQNVIISGTVLDQSPAQPGTACVSDASMSTWMSYLHMQMPIGGLYGNVTIQGVPVTLTAVDPNGNTIPIGTVTTDGTTGTFGYTWTAPTVTGNYKITATFAGDDSYSFSWATTYATVVAPTATPTPIPTAAPVTGLATASDLTYGIIAAVIAIIIAVAIATVLMLRKKP